LDQGGFQSIILQKNIGHILSLSPSQATDHFNLLKRCIKIV
jgi:hypothetical protein